MMASFASSANEDASRSRRMARRRQATRLSGWSLSAAAAARARIASRVAARRLARARQRAASTVRLADDSSSSFVACVAALAAASSSASTATRASARPRRTAPLPRLRRGLATFSRSVRVSAAHASRVAASSDSGGYATVASVPHTRSADASGRTAAAAREFELERRRVGDFPTREIAQVPSPRRPEIGRRDGDAGRGGFRGIVRGEARGGRDHLVQRGHGAAADRRRSISCANRGRRAVAFAVAVAVASSSSSSWFDSSSAAPTDDVGVRVDHVRAQDHGGKRDVAVRRFGRSAIRLLNSSVRFPPFFRRLEAPTERGARGVRGEIYAARDDLAAFARVTRASREASPDAAKISACASKSLDDWRRRGRDGREPSRERERRRGRRRAGRCTRERSGSRRERLGSRRERLGSRRERLGSRREASPRALYPRRRCTTSARGERRATLACAARRWTTRRRISASRFASAVARRRARRDANWRSRARRRGGDAPTRRFAAGSPRTRPIPPILLMMRGTGSDRRWGHSGSREYLEAPGRAVGRGVKPGGRGEETSRERRAREETSRSV